MVFDKDRKINGAGFQGTDINGLTTGKGCGSEAFFAEGKVYKSVVRKLTKANVRRIGTLFSVFIQSVGISVFTVDNPAIRVG